MPLSLLRSLRFGRLSAIALAAALWAPPTHAAGSTTTEFAEEKLIGGTKVVQTDFKSFPKWDRIRKILIKHKSYNPAVLTKWLTWAEGLKDKPQRDRLAAINGRVNKSFPYKTDRRLWNKDDFWEDPEQAAKKGALDCEGYAIFKYFLGLSAGIDAEDMAVLIGRIRSTGEFHAIMIAHADGRNYVLDNRKRYMIDMDTERDFASFYSVDLDDIWLYMFQ